MYRRNNNRPSISMPCHFCGKNTGWHGWIPKDSKKPHKEWISVWTHTVCLALRPRTKEEYEFETVGRIPKEPFVWEKHGYAWSQNLNKR